MLPSTAEQAPWTGTNLPARSIAQAAAALDAGASLDMARWPDPALRRVAAPVPARAFGTRELAAVCAAVRARMRAERAAGLAASQLGVDARVVALAPDASSGAARALTLVNPRVVARSREAAARPWRERCLALPPALEVELLRDDWVRVAARAGRG